MPEVLFVTGGCCGIGQELARQFVERYPGCKLAIFNRTANNAALVKLEALAGHGNVAFYCVDVSDFDALREAPESGYTNLEAVPVAVGDVFAVRSRRDPAFGNVRCRRFAKMEILAIDMGEGTVTFRHLRNPNCEKRTLVPGAEE